MTLNNPALTTSYKVDGSSRTVFGSVEIVSVPSLQLEGIIAKVDTGAWTGALHCTNIQLLDGKLHYTPLDGSRGSVETEEFQYRSVRSASGHSEKRYIIPLEIIIRNKKYQTSLGLTDRTVMQREMLLGRRFLIENKILVDVLMTLEDDQEAEKYL